MKITQLILTIAMVMTATSSNKVQAADLGTILGGVKLIVDGATGTRYAPPNFTPRAVTPSVVTPINFSPGVVTPGVVTPTNFNFGIPATGPVVVPSVAIPPGGFTPAPAPTGFAPQLQQPRQVNGVWNVIDLTGGRSSGQATIVQTGANFTLHGANGRLAGSVHGLTCTLHHPQGQYQGSISPDGRSIRFPHMLLSRPQFQPPMPAPVTAPLTTPIPGPSGNAARWVSLQSLKCTDLQNDRLTDRVKHDNVEVQVLADGRLVDNFTVSFSQADEGQTKSLNRPVYRFTNSLRVEVLIDGNRVGQPMELKANSRGRQTGSFQGGISPRVSWTHYDVLLSVH